MNKIFEETKTNKLCFIYYCNNIAQYGGYYNALDQRLIDNDTQFRIASVTKPIIGLLIFVLHYNKIIDIKSSINCYPKLKHWNPNITILHLLSHTSRLAQWAKGFNYKTESKYFKSMSEILDTFINDGEEYKIGEYHYSNIGYMTLGYIIEYTTNDTWIGALTKYVLKPLKMTNTGTGLLNNIYTCENGKIIDINVPKSKNQI